MIAEPEYGYIMPEDEFAHTLIGFFFAKRL